MAKYFLLVTVTLMVYNEYRALGSEDESCLVPYEKSFDVKITLKKNGSSTWIPSYTAKKYAGNLTELLEMDLEHEVKKCGPHDFHQVTASIRGENDIHNTHEAPDSKDVSEGYLCRRKIGLGKTGNKMLIKNNGPFSTVISKYPLQKNEMFEATLDWEDGLWFFVVGLTNQTEADIMSPHWLEDNRPGTLAWYAFVPHTKKAHVFYRNEALYWFQGGEKFGLMLKEDSNLHFYSNGTDEGPRAFNLTDPVHVFIELLHHAGKGLKIEE